MQNIQIAHKPYSLPTVLRECLPLHFCDAILRMGANQIKSTRLNSSHKSLSRMPSSA